MKSTYDPTFPYDDVQGRCKECQKQSYVGSPTLILQDVDVTVLMLFQLCGHTSYIT